MAAFLTEHQFLQADVLDITRLRKELLQTWVNRNVVTLSQKNPGSGKRRLYSVLDIVKLALFRRIADLGLALDIGRDLAGEAERLLTGGGGVEWELHLSLKKSEAVHKEVEFTVIASAGHSVLSLNYGGTVGDARHLLVSHFTEPFESIWHRRTRTWSDDRPIDPELRANLAKQGIYAEPVVIFPFGEVVNGTLLQIAARCEAASPALATSLETLAAGKQHLRAERNHDQ